ncbi:MAG TPA: maleylpyruvate isomerase family mycothiol-dependent enzyme [Candidatus Dormibacteraeota bacterium]|nr:maleylpyruvate isomerase family mycothiol-dependent enzyme [Candidatus Dormibacteraeota bacterium]
MSPSWELPTADWIASIKRESRHLELAAARTQLDWPVPTCPDWQVRDLVRHLGGVHRWATAHVAEQRLTAMPREEEYRLMGSAPADESLLSWFGTGHRALCRALSGATPELQCWSFLPASSPLAFWARRQAHETEIHRADAEIAAGAVPTPFPAEVAADGVEELLFGFAPRRRRLGLESESRVALLPRDLSRGWLVRFGPSGVQAERVPGDADCVIRGSASEIYLLLWNRLSAETLQIDGDPQALANWRRALKITWS